jgi:hypothetical protein
VSRAMIRHPVGAIFLQLMLAAAPSGATAAAEIPSAPPAPQPTPAPAAAILAPLMPQEPVPGQGRMAVHFSGNRRWCTFPDDRVAKPPADPRRTPQALSKKNEIFTFGYTFTISAVKRGLEGQTIMLYESPVFRTAKMRTAGKGGPVSSKPSRMVGPGVGAKPFSPGATPRTGGSTLVPFWDERYRCTTVPERFDFDLEPGTYDVYAAFDIMDQGGTWVHRSTGFVTDVSIESGRQTRVEGTVGMGGPAQRTLSLESSTLLPAKDSLGASGP